MTSKHTPGPWRLDPCWDIIGNTDQGTGVVCDVTHGAYFQPGEAEANGRLIAAAPELLDALQAVLKLEPPLQSKKEMAAWNRVRRSIAKAEGRE